MSWNCRAPLHASMAIIRARKQSNSFIRACMFCSFQSTSLLESWRRLLHDRLGSMRVGLELCFVRAVPLRRQLCLCFQFSLQVDSRLFLHLSLQCLKLFDLLGFEIEAASSNRHSLCSQYALNIRALIFEPPEMIREQVMLAASIATQQHDACRISLATHTLSGSCFTHLAGVENHEASVRIIGWTRGRQWTRGQRLDRGETTVARVQEARDGGSSGGNSGRCTQRGGSGRSGDRLKNRQGARGSGCCGSGDCGSSNRGRSDNSSGRASNEGTKGAEHRGRDCGRCVDGDGEREQRARGGRGIYTDRTIRQQQLGERERKEQMTLFVLSRTPLIHRHRRCRRIGIRRRARRSLRMRLLRDRRNRRGGMTRDRVLCFPPRRLRL